MHKIFKVVGANGLGALAKYLEPLLTYFHPHTEESIVLSSGNSGNTFLYLDSKGWKPASVLHSTLSHCENDIFDLLD
jgi:hypothetical protein